MELIKVGDGMTVPFGRASEWLTDTVGLIRVCGSARVSGSARVCGDGEIEYTEDYITVGPIGTRKSTITMHRDKKTGIRVVAGCWSGTYRQFMSRLNLEIREHKEYKSLIPVAYKFLKSRIKSIRLKAGKE